MQSSESFCHDEEEAMDLPIQEQTIFDGDFNSKNELELKYVVLRNHFFKQEQSIFDSNFNSKN